MSNPADMLQNAHTLLCGHILEILQKEDPTVQEMKLAMEFLKNNKIEALVVPGSPLERVVRAAERFEVTPTVNLARPLAFPSFPEGDVMDSEDPAVAVR